MEDVWFSSTLKTNPNISAYSTNGDLSMNSGQGLAITFEVESFNTTANTPRFFELYRSTQPVQN